MMATLIDLRHIDAQDRGNKPEPDAIPYVPDHALAAAIRVHTDVVRELANQRDGGARNGR